MKPRRFVGLFVFTALLPLALTAEPGDADWQELKAALQKGLTKSALIAIDPIITRAIETRTYPEAIRDIAQKIELQASLEGNKPEDKIARWQAELAKAPAEMKPMIEAILAHSYWQYFEQNRWRFWQRTQTASAPGDDIQTWDLARILAEIDRHFTAALADEKTLKAIPISAYDALLPRGNMPDAYRPTLYDFIAHEALGYYQAGEHQLPQAEDAFEVDADSPIFKDAAAFIRWEPKTTDPTSPTFRAVQLYRKLLAFHATDRDRSAFLDADLARIEFGKNVAHGETKSARYQAALQTFIATATDHELSARGLAALARQLAEEGNPAEARMSAQQGLYHFPESVGGAECFNLVQQIEAKSAELKTETVWNAPWPTLDVTYRNVTHVYFRAVRMNFEELLRTADHIDEEKWLGELIGTKPALAWDAELPATTDFKPRTEKLPSPATLPPGFYFILASWEPSFALDHNQISIARVWVSDLALVLQQRSDAPTRGFVLRAGSGEPVPQATVRIWQKDENDNISAAPPIITDADGAFEVPESDRQQRYHITAESDGQTIGNLNPLWASRIRERESRDRRAMLFTDRALYRPGQTINYTGVAIRSDVDAGKYSVDAGRTLTVVFNDPNGKEIARATHRTNDYGSFDGVFTAPRDRLTGTMTIRMLDETGATVVQVEEYKRPKFQAEFAPPAKAPKLDASVTLTGKAMAYTGAAIGGAKVKWRVERDVRFPVWCWWAHRSGSQAIAHGGSTTRPDGTFTVEFTALPDRTVPEKDEPVFVFTIFADVTDINGETRSCSRALRVGYTALQATLSADEWQTVAKPVTLTVQTASFDDDPQPAEGTLTIHALQQPATVTRAELEPRFGRFPRILSGGSDPALPDPSDPKTWPLGAQFDSRPLRTDTNGKAEAALPLPAGTYRARFETKDRFGKMVVAQTTVEVLDPAAPRYSIKVPQRLTAEKWSVTPGETFTAVWGTGYDRGRALVEIECNGRLLERRWTPANRTQERVELPITEDMRGGVTLRTIYVRENRGYLEERTIDIPWSNQQLSVKWERFRSKLVPGQKETWTAIVSGPDAKRATAEIVATLYDASLDQYAAHPWPDSFRVFRRESQPTFATFLNTTASFTTRDAWEIESRPVSLWYRTLPADIAGERSMAANATTGFLLRNADVASDGMVTLSAFQVTAERRGSARALAMPSRPDPSATVLGAAFDSLRQDRSPGTLPPSTQAAQITARKNLNETAFFFPRLMTDKNGVVKLEFTMPEALTEWKFLGFAHDKKLRAGLLVDKVVTAKDIMVEPNPPRFVREGDAIEFTVKVSNQTDQSQSGQVQLTFADAATLQPVDAALDHRATTQSFELPAKQSRSYSWRISVPDGLGFLTYKAVGATANASDGEEGVLPVLSRRILVTESLPLAIRGKATKQFAFPKLLASGQSDTLRQQSLTVQMVSQPAWYAVMALPSLMEFPYECSEQVFNRFYANALARHIAGSDPKLRRIFDLWKRTPALESPLEKNQDLKAVLLEETPWVRDAQQESQARKNLGELFDANRLDAEAARTLQTLADRQSKDGLWSWFPGGRSSEYISLYIVTGFGRMRHLGVQVDVAPAIKALIALDQWMEGNYRRILKQPDPENYVPSYLDAFYLYGRSFFLNDQPLATPHRDAVEFFLRQSRKFWLKVDCRQSQAHLALALQRFGDAETPPQIMKSIKERSVRTEELGMFWRDLEPSWWWYRAPIETQAMMIEAFAEVSQDAAAVEDCKVWLLKQKQTQDWKTTKATADAIYGLLLRGENLLASDALVEVSLAGQPIKPEEVEAGTGFYQRKFVREEIKPAMGQITVTKVDDGVSWGAVHWQYLEDMRKVTSHENTPLKLKKTLWIKETTARGPVLRPVSGPIAVGDELVVRIELRSDRDMEYVHLKDQRGSGTEPINVLSRYRYQDGLAYYESTRDTASHFFIDYLPKGTYVFEYSSRIQLKGTYQTGIAEIQCMYAPEFNSHSESFAIEVK